MTYNNDILGNRTEKGTTIDYTWDQVNRMKAFVNTASTTCNYKYRADGMRINKVEGLLLDWIFDEESARWPGQTLYSTCPRQEGMIVPLLSG